MKFFKRLRLVWKIKRLHRKGKKEKDPMKAMNYMLQIFEEIKKAKEQGL
jgi:hypothetical protein